MADAPAASKEAKAADHDREAKPVLGGAIAAAGAETIPGKPAGGMTAEEAIAAGEARKAQREIVPLECVPGAQVGHVFFLDEVEQLGMFIIMFGIYTAINIVYSSPMVIDHVLDVSVAVHDFQPYLPLIVCAGTWAVWIPLTCFILGGSTNADIKHLNTYTVIFKVFFYGTFVCLLLLMIQALMLVGAVQRGLGDRAAYYIPLMIVCCFVCAMAAAGVFFRARISGENPGD